jgi:hypothetical protein
MGGEENKKKKINGDEATMEGKFWSVFRAEN